MPRSRSEYVPPDLSTHTVFMEMQRAFDPTLRSMNVDNQILLRPTASEIDRMTLRNDEDALIQLCPMSPRPFNRMFHEPGGVDTRIYKRYVLQVIDQNLQIKFWQIGNSILAQLINICLDNPSFLPSFYTKSTWPVLKYDIFFEIGPSTPARHTSPPVQHIRLEECLINRQEIPDSDLRFYNLAHVANIMQERHERLWDRYNRFRTNSSSRNSNTTVRNANPIAPNTISLPRPDHINSRDWNNMTALEQEYLLRDDNDSTITL